MQLLSLFTFHTNVTLVVLDQFVFLKQKFIRICIGRIKIKNNKCIVNPEKVDSIFLMDY